MKRTPAQYARIFRARLSRAIDEAKREGSLIRDLLETIGKEQDWDEFIKDAEKWQRERISRDRST